MLVNTFPCVPNHCLHVSQHRYHLPKNVPSCPSVLSTFAPTPFPLYCTSVPYCKALIRIFAVYVIVLFLGPGHCLHSILLITLNQFPFNDNTLYNTLYVFLYLLYVHTIQCMYVGVFFMMHACMLCISYLIVHCCVFGYLRKCIKNVKGQAQTKCPI